MNRFDITSSPLDNRDTLRDRIVEREVKKRGLKGKIRAFCCHCLYDPYSEGTWLKQVKKCSSWHCPLYSVRPLPKGMKHKEVDDG